MKKILFILVLLVFLGSILYYNAVYVNPKQLTIREEYIKNDKVDPSFDGFTVVFFSDLHFGFISNELFEKAMEHIRSLQPDVILFGGDLVDHYSNHPLNEEDRAYLTNALYELDAPYGKFAVLGNHDLDSENTKNAITNILHDAGFEVITNRSATIYNKEGKHFNLVGIDSMALGSPDIAAAYKGVDPSAYTMVISHTPDLFDEVEGGDLMLSGHSHGGQVYLSFLTKFYLPYGSNQYYHGHHKKNGMTLDVSNGVGMTAKSIRLFADAEIVAYQFDVN